MFYSDPYFEFAESAWRWAEEEIKEIDKFYSEKIPDNELRFTFLKGLAWGFIEDDDSMQNELKKCGFKSIHYYFMADDFKGIEECYKKHLYG